MSGLALASLAACGGSASAAPSAHQRLVVGLITKSNVGYFQAMQTGAQQEAKALDVDLRIYQAKAEGDTASQITAIHKLMAAGAKGILITPNGAGVLPAIAQARQAGMLVIALDSPTDPADAVDSTFATNNFAAGQSIGQWAAGSMDPARARIAMIDLNASHVPVDVARDQGFLSGFGIGLGDPNKIGDESDPRIVAHGLGQGDPTDTQPVMAALLRAHPEVNLVYTMNEGTATGVLAALKAAGLEGKVRIVTIDGGCSEVADLASNAVGATAMQFPLRMARLGLDAVLDHALTGDKPANSPGLAFFNTGYQLVTNQPVAGLYSQDPDFDQKHCWG